MAPKNADNSKGIAEYKPDGKIGILNIRHIIKHTTDDIKELKNRRNSGVDFSERPRTLA